MLKRIVIAACAAALLAAVPVHAAKPLTGQPAPDFTLPTLDGKEFKLSDFKDKKAVVVTLTQTACKSCIDEMKMLTPLVGVNKNVEIVAISVDRNAGTDPWKARLAEVQKEFEINVPMLLDPKFTVGKSWKLTATPSLVIVGKDGVITDVVVGFDPDEAKEIVEKIKAIK